jgi:hypothetical protein
MDNQQETKFVNIRVDVTKVGSSETRRGAPTFFSIGYRQHLAFGWIAASRNNCSARSSLR